MPTESSFLALGLKVHILPGRFETLEKVIQKIIFYNHLVLCQRIFARIAQQVCP